MSVSDAEAILTGEYKDDPPTTVPQPKADVYFNGNDNVIRDLLFDQIRYHTFPSFVCNETMSQGVWMRRTLITWLREVCEHRHTEPEVLAHTVQLIDRYLTVENIDKRDYQLVGASCYLVSSKLKETVPVSVDELVRYTDFSITKNDLMTRELLIAIALHFDLTMITPFDFIQPLVCYLPCGPELQQLIRKSANRIALKVIHIEILNWSLPSYIAAALVLYAVHLTVEPEQRDLTKSAFIRMNQVLVLDPMKARESYKLLLSLFKPGTVELADNVKRVDRGDEADSEVQQGLDASPQQPTGTSTPGDQLSSSSFYSGTSSSSFGPPSGSRSASHLPERSVNPVSPTYEVEQESDSLREIVDLTSDAGQAVADGSDNGIEEKDDDDDDEESQSDSSYDGGDDGGGNEDGDDSTENY